MALFNAPDVVTFSFGKSLHSVLSLFPMLITIRYLLEVDKFENTDRTKYLGEKDTSFSL